MTGHHRDDQPDRGARAWFRPKMFGWGFAPATWQGWLVTLVYVALVVILHPNRGDPVRIAGAVLLTLGFIAIAWSRTEGGWRWTPTQRR